MRGSCFWENREFFDKIWAWALRIFWRLDIFLQNMGMKAVIFREKTGKKGILLTSLAHNIIKKRALNSKWPIMGHVTNLKSMRVWPEVIDFCPKKIEIFDPWSLRFHDKRSLTVRPKLFRFGTKIVKVLTQYHWDFDLKVIEIWNPNSSKMFKISTRSVCYFDPILRMYFPKNTNISTRSLHTSFRTKNVLLFFPINIRVN